MSYPGQPAWWTKRDVQRRAAMGILAPGNKPPAGPPVKALGDVYRSCDSCGHAHDNVAVGRALYQVETENGPLYFCGHHFRKNSTHIFEQGYPIQELRRTASSSGPVYL